MPGDVVQQSPMFSEEWMRQYFRRMNVLEKGAKSRIAARREAMQVAVEAQLRTQRGSVCKLVEVPLPCSVDMTWFLRESGRLQDGEFQQIVTAVEFRVNHPFGSGSNPTGKTIFTVDLSDLNEREAARLLDRFVAFVVRKFA